MEFSTAPRIGKYSTGLVSVTFRQLSPQEIVALVAAASQRGIEWGGDVHVPAGDLAQAHAVGQMTRDAGLEVVCYGSYYRCGEQKPGEPEFETVLETALALGAPSIRVWAGRRSPQDYTQEEAQAVKDDYVRICELALTHQIDVATEFHGKTLTENRPSTVQFFRGIDLPNAKSLWQPHARTDFATCLATMDDVQDRLAHIHVFHWGAGGWTDRRPLAEGEEDWKAYLDAVAADGQHRWALIEFVAGDDPAHYPREAATLNHWVQHAAR
ncbi:MAG: TIM barrel protein [Verrucomicrobiota bacterium JB022]|nr:TIM barrel protein [Verrucomicrobiota bacterium JB022]